MYYMLNGRKVKVVAQYSGIWFYEDDSGATGKALDILFTPVSDGGSFVNRIENILSSTPSNPKTDTRIPFDETPLTEDNILRINSATKAQIAVLKGRVGKLAAARIHERRPEGGYRGWEDLKEINADLSVDWDAVSLDETIVIDFS
jgi:hypothetical protein